MFEILKYLLLQRQFKVLATDQTQLVQGVIQVSTILTLKNIFVITDKKLLCWF